MKDFKLLFAMLFCLGYLTGNTQIDNSIFNNNTHISPADSHKLLLRIENTDFLKNNEYFNNFYVGFTLFGYIIKPKLVYYPNANTKIEAGGYFLKYDGVDGFSEVLPLLTFQYNYHDWFNIVMGSIYGSYNHHLIEPLYQEDRYYRDKPENGLQLLFNFSHFESEVWCAWERFIFPGSPFKEQIFAGTSNKIIFTNPENKLSVVMPLQAIIKHYGGQIDSSPMNMSSIVNSASGLDINYKTGKIIKSIGLDGYIVTFNDISPQSPLRYVSGYGMLTDFCIKTKYADLYLGYWNGMSYVAPKGEPLFQSMSQIDSTYFIKNRQLLTCKLDIGRKLGKNIMLRVRFESYYDLKVKNLDYSYGINIVFNSDFFLKKIRLLNNDN